MSTYNNTETWPRLVGDIGGTNARFAVLDRMDGELRHVTTLACRDFPGPAEAIRAWADSHAIDMPSVAAIGIANPILGDMVRVTNNDWKFSIEATRQALGLKRLHFVNDFTALALSLPHLAATERRQIGGGEAVPDTAIGVIGPGTGLGVSGLLPVAGRYVPIEGEGGHVTLSTQSAEESAVQAVLATQFPHVSAERVLSGPGLLTLYHALAQVRGQQARELDSPAISEAAVKGEDALCVASVDMFCALLGTAAANLAVTLGARGGIYIGGGIVPKLGDYFAQSPFRARFEDKGRFSTYLSRIPTWVITAAYPALRGVAAALD